MLVLYFEIIKSVHLSPIVSNNSPVVADLNCCSFGNSLLSSTYNEIKTTSFFKIGENKIELLEATSPESAISKFIEKKGEGVHHIAFEVENIYAEIERLKKEGFQLIHETPKKGADNKLICFLHPKSTNGVLIELCQEIK